MNDTLSELKKLYGQESVDFVKDMAAHAFNESYKSMMAVLDRAGDARPDLAIPIAALTLVQWEQGAVKMQREILVHTRAPAEVLAEFDARRAR